MVKPGYIHEQYTKLRRGIENDLLFEFETNTKTKIIFLFQVRQLLRKNKIKQISIKVIPSIHFLKIVKETQKNLI